MFFALRARREYLAAFRRSIVQQDMRAGEIRLETADLSTIEALVEELAHPEAKRVAYALDLLESLDKRHLVSPLMLLPRASPTSGCGCCASPRPPAPPAPSGGSAASSAD